MDEDENEIMLDRQKELLKLKSRIFGVYCCWKNGKISPTRNKVIILKLKRKYLPLQRPNPHGLQKCLKSMHIIFFNQNIPRKLGEDYLYNQNDD